MALSAGLYSAAFPPVGLWIASWIAVVPLLLALATASTREGALLGLAWSLLVGLGTASFVPQMIATYFGVGTLLAWLAAGGATAATGVAYAGFAGVLSWRLRRGPAGPLCVAGLWGLCELARTALPFPNPWAMSGYSQLPYSTIAQTADLVGVAGLGILVVSVNALLCSLFSPAFRPHSLRWESLAVVSLFISASAYGHFRLQRNFETGEPSVVALVQGAIPRAVRKNPAHHSAILNHYRDLSRRIDGKPVSLVLWPEYSLELVLRSGSPEHRALAELSSELGADLLVGTLTRAPSPRADEFRNSAILLRGDAWLDAYHKVSLMPYGETEAGSPWLRGVEYTLVPGTSRQPLSTSAGSLGVLLCNEVMLSGPARETVRAGAQILANPSNDDWFGRRGADLQLQIAAFRAIENRRYLLRPTHSGVTAVVDPHGAVRSIPPGNPGVLLEKIGRSFERSIYNRWGDLVPLAVACLALVASREWRIAAS
jgi:apolipoprotein N-acyltransferase